MELFLFYESVSERRLMRVWVNWLAIVVGFSFALRFAPTIFKYVTMSSAHVTTWVAYITGMSFM